MSKINKIIFFVEVYFNKSYYKQFGIDLLIENCFDVEVWDYTLILTNKEYQEIKLPDPIQWGKYFLLRNKKEALSKLSDLTSSCFIVAFMHYNHQTYFIFRMLSKKDVKYCVPGTTLPISTTQKELFIKRVKTFSIKRLLHRLFREIPFELLGLKPAYLVLAWAEKYSLPGFSVNKKNQIVWVHSFDYDFYLSKKDIPTKIDQNVGIFLDEYLPFHPDFLYIGVSAPVTPEEYYPMLCRFFNILEKSYGVRIIIAAHPRANYDVMPDYFGGRPVIRGETGELVSKSGFVLLHHSAAINHAVLFKKPMIFITSNKINDGLVEDPSPVWLAEFFGKKAHILDEEINMDFEKELHVDNDAYRAYKNAYIKKDGSEELLFWQIVANRIKQIR